MLINKYLNIQAIEVISAYLLLLHSGLISLSVSRNLFLRKVNGPGTPRPMNRLKISSSSSLATNGLLDSTENKDTNTASSHSKPVGYTSPALLNSSSYFLLHTLLNSVLAVDYKFQDA